MKVRDLTQQRFGKLTAIELAGRAKNRQALWKCKCDCGNETTVPSNKLVSGATGSCGCSAANKPLNLTGQKFGKLTVIKKLNKTGRSRAVLWECICDCGKTTIVEGPKIKFGHTNSCGCSWVVNASKLNKTHGQSKSPTYRTWKAMKARCYNKKAMNYPNYGGRGIFVCDEWLASYEVFFHDMGERPLNLTLDRIDNDGPYAPWNCRWVTRAEQNQNKRQRKDSKK